VPGFEREGELCACLDDCTDGIDRITHCDDLIATPINLGSSELVSINELDSLAEAIGGVQLERKSDLTAPRGKTAIIR
jgi:hypothetical protein